MESVRFAAHNSIISMGNVLRGECGRLAVTSRVCLGLGWCWFLVMGVTLTNIRLACDLMSEKYIPS